MKRVSRLSPALKKELALFLLNTIYTRLATHCRDHWEWLPAYSRAELKDIREDVTKIESIIKDL